MKGPALSRYVCGIVVLLLHRKRIIKAICEFIRAEGSSVTRGQGRSHPSSRNLRLSVDAKAISRASHSLVQHLLPLKKMNTHNTTRNNNKKEKEKEKERERENVFS
jgi:hypothetical protein